MPNATPFFVFSDHISSTSVAFIAHPALQHRLLQDIAELQTKPYSNIKLHVQDDNISTACLILTVESYGSMHLTVNFPANYTLSPPSIRMDSKVTHPNIKKEDMGHICASILDTEMDYTSAYTLKGIAIQLLSFFSSDRIQQVDGDFFFDLEAFRAVHLDERADDPPYQCPRCNFGATNYISSEISLSQGNFAEAWPKVGHVINEFNVIRTRELKCFCLKLDFLETKLGVGIDLAKVEKGNQHWVVSEFDIISQDDFNLGVGRSVQGVPFQYWLPLPVSELHWAKVRDDVHSSLAHVNDTQNYGNVTSDYTLFQFLNDIIIKLSK
ncbi:hypothetical protein IFR05_001133 [Cadophora sp. M221]|nr:hypothetical protein IFR05_001133 [Cadophora sp. M221]